MCLLLPCDDYILGLLDKDRTALGVPNEASIVRRYCELRGLPDSSHWNFYLASSYFRIVAIARGVKKLDNLRQRPGRADRIRSGLRVRSFLHIFDESMKGSSNGLRLSPES